MLLRKRLQSPERIAMDLVESQETRRALDRHFGFSLSPLLWRLFPSNNHSAGRVQSPALRMIVEREKEIEAFQAQEYWSINAELKKDVRIQVKLSSFEGKPVKKFTFSSKTIVESAAEKLENNCKDGLIASSIVKKQIKRSPKAPFTTSSMIQEASRKLGFPPKLTMSLAGSLHGHGLITYHRTDSIGDRFKQAT